MGKVVRGVVFEPHYGYFMEYVQEPPGESPVDYHGDFVPVVLVDADLLDGLTAVLRDIVERGYGHAETIDNCRRLLAELEGE